MIESPPFDATGLARTWTAVLGRLEVELPRPLFQTWVRGTTLLRYDADTGLATIEAASSFACTNLQETCHLVVLRALQSLLPEVRDIMFTEPTFTRREQRHTNHTSQSAGRLVGSVNCSFTLESYVVSDANRLAKASCFALLTSPAERITPVVVYGPPGHGKSHLIHALCNEAIRRGKSVACLSAEQFANHYLGSIKQDSIDQFHRAVRSVDLLVVDDLQYLTGKTGTANELSQTMDAVSHAGGSVVLASECSPLVLVLPDRLLSRLGQGLVTAIGPMDREARLQFIAQTTRVLGTELPGWAVERIASLKGISVRTLQGVVSGAIHLQRNGALDLGALDASIAARALTAALPAERSAQDIMEEVAIHFSTTFDEVCSSARHRQVADARAVIAYLLVRRGMSQNAVAATLGRDRSTIRGILAKGEGLFDSDENLRSKFGAA